MGVHKVQEDLFGNLNKKNMTKKIMFNDKFLLTQAVLEGRKTQTRRLIKCRKTFKGEWVAGFNIHIRPSDKKVVGLPCMYDADESEFDGGEILPKYNVGEVVAVAQSYRDCGGINKDGRPNWDVIAEAKGASNAGWDNKMFVRGDLMPHKIRITNVRIQRLQDISDEDCLKEGIQTFYYGDCKFPPDGYTFDNGKSHFNTPREAFAHLINKVSRKDVWKENPYVFVYDFEVIK